MRRSLGLNLVRTDNNEQVQMFVDASQNRPIIAFSSADTGAWTEYKLSHRSEILPLSLGGTGASNYVDYEVTKRNWFYDNYITVLDTTTDVPANWPSGFFYCFLYSGFTNIYCPTSYGIWAWFRSFIVLVSSGKWYSLPSSRKAAGWSGSASPTNYSWVGDN